MRVGIFIVFHCAVDERLLFEYFTAEEVREHFTLYGVNALRPDKTIIRLNGQKQPAGPNMPNLQLEYQLPWHDPALQERGFMEASCYVHLHRNGLHASLDYVGITQYDMRWTPMATAILRAIAAAPAAVDSGQTVVYAMPCGRIMGPAGGFHPWVYPAAFNWDFFLDSYNRFFGKNWDRNVLIDKPFTIWQTYLMPRDQFADLASWLEVLCAELHPWAAQPPYPTHWGTLGGAVERAESVFIAARVEEQNITVEKLGLYHDATIAKNLAITREHYGGISRS